MQYNLEARCAQQSSRLTRRLHIMPAFVYLKDMIIQTLCAHLHFRHAEMTQPSDFIHIDLSGPRLDDEPHIAMMSRFVDGLGLHKFTLTPAPLPVREGV